MSDRDDRAADVLADLEPVECRECGGTGTRTEWTPYEWPCPYCEGTGYWLGQP